MRPRLKLKGKELKNRERNTMRKKKLTERRRNKKEKLLV
jgi:hypothetical protein